ncbi:adenosine deaminase [Dethiosulfatarculus sandiegensis]|uniref:Adenosine deaminase domain-containing protein n=1 Tax=Dethiosulfatarculus sandiegensis TaxID=1429043 RepID=A0A0D2G7U0_9BACT|nr:adenosine deaminase [Dethiosulfatarculus sandiegensis]KIX10992.1 hypothetical protein X474_26910 [Dethiosulfatarculus sandiegensis]
MPDWCHTEPKAELHIHLEGSVFPQTLNRLAHKKGLPQVAEDFYDFRDFDGFNQCLMHVLGLLTTEEDYYRLALDFTDRQASQNIIYTEAFFMPYLHLVNGGHFEAIKQGLEAGFKEAEAGRQVRVRLLFNLPRGLDREAGFKTLELIEKYKWDRVLGIDLAGKEGKGDIAPRADIFAKARSMGLKTVAHAGEFSPASQMAETLRLLKPHRIGHGLSAINDEKVIETLIKTGVCLEMAPTSNLLLGAVGDISDHPLPQLLQKGVKVVLNTDDPAFFKTSLNRELDLVHNEMQVSEKDLKRLIRNGFEQAFGF